MLVFRRGLALVRAATDVQGRYLVVLAPGVWSVSTRSGVRIAPMRVRVVEGRMRGVDFAIDTGIR